MNSCGNAFLSRVAIVLISTVPLVAQHSPNAENARSSNTSLLRLYAQYLNASPAQKPALRTQAAAILAQRAALFGALIQNDPHTALQFAFSQDLLDALLQAFPDSAPLLESRGVWQGQADVWVLDAADMRNSKTAIQLNAAQERLDVVFADGPPKGLRCGSVLTVRGVRRGTTVAADGGTVSSSTLPAATCSTTGSQNTAVLLVTFPGVTPSLTPSAVYNMMFGAGNRSLDGYWRDVSYGKTSATGNVFGWYTLPNSYTCDQYSSIQSAAIAAADNDVYFPNYTRIFIVFPKPANCTYGGLGTVGCTSVTSADGASNASVAWLIADYLGSNDQGVEMAAHEGGHNLGLNHSRSRDFGTDTLGALGALGTVSEYGDNFSPMGYYNLGHYAAQQKYQLGWLPAANVQTIQSGGAFSIAPFEWNTAAVQALKVQRGTGNDDWLWIEYRQPIGNYESTLSSQIFSGATIRYVDSNTGAYTDLLDYTPQTSSWSDPDLSAGLTWVDPYTNVSIASQNATSNGLTVSVNYGAGTCAPGNPTVAVSPANPTVAAGNSVNYSVTITNTDSAACASTAFSLGTSQPSGWTAAVSPTLVTLTAGQSATVTMSQGPPSSTSTGTYAVAAIASAGTRSGTGNANCSVTAPPPLSVTLAISGSTFSARSTVPITATVLSGNLPTSGATVQFTMTKPNGTKSTYTGTTNANGQVAWNYKFGPKDPSGTYKVTATATRGSQTAQSTAATFVVQ